MYDFRCSILDIANDFYEAYLRCSSGVDPIMVSDSTQKSKCVNIPAIVNGSFAIELYLKYLLIDRVHSKPKKNHNIMKLFGELDPALQNSLKSRITEKLDSNDSFEKCIETLNESFVFWRYIYEKESFGFGVNDTLKVLPAFLEALRKEANNDLEG